MFKTGIFQTPEQTYTIYEISEPGFYRIDFVRDAGAFQVDFDKVVYSQVHRKNTSVKGDSKLYELWQELRHKALEMKLDVNTESSWLDGKYVTRVHSYNKKTGVTVDVYKEMNEVVTENIVIDGYVMTMDTTDTVYGVKIEPIDIRNYEVLKTNRATVSTDNPDLPYHSLETLRRTLNIEHLFKEDFVYADSILIADQRLEMIDKANPEYLGVDTETTGLDVNIYGEDKIVGIILAQDEHTSTYFPFRMKNDAPNLPISYLEKIDKLIRKYIDRTVLHNIKFDRKAFLKDDLDYCFKWDTLQGSIILNPILKKGVHELKNLMLELTGKRYLELTDIFVNKKDIEFALLPKEIARLYACPDSSSVITLLKHQLKKIPAYQMKLFELECALTSVTADNEYFGMRVDVVKYEKQYKNCNFVREELLTAFRKLTHCDGNINSNQVLSELIYGKMHCDILSRTKTGTPSTSAAAIDKLAAKKRDKPGAQVKDIVDLYGEVVISGEKLSAAKYPALLVLSTYKKYTKLVTAFYARFERTMQTGRVFFWVNQNGTLTGRMSSPMHQLPKQLKDVILSDGDNWDLWGPDYSQVELRMIAYLAGQKDLIELCKDPDNDIHRAIGSLINNCEMWEITNEQRSTGKRRNFGVVYLISKFGLAGQMFGPGATAEQIEFAEQQLCDFYSRFKRIDRYIKRNKEKVLEKGYMETKWLHRKRIFPEVFDPDLEPRRRASILRMANNLPVQGTAADLLKLSLVDMYNYIREKGWYKNIGGDKFPMVRIMLSIHDEILISADKSIPYEEIIRMITLCMDKPVKDAPPFFVQPAKLRTWEDHNDDALPLPIPLRNKLIEDYERTGVSVINEGNYEKVIKDYRDAELEKYMADLIAQYGTDYRIVGEKVRHPSLSHELIKSRKELKKFEGTQAEKITEATRLYINDLLSSGKATSTFVITNEKMEDADIHEELQVAYGELEELVDFDANGEIVYEENDQEEYDEYFYDDYLDAEELKKFAENKPVYVYEMGDGIVFDTEDLPNDKVNEVLAYASAHSEEDGFFKVYIAYGGVLLDTTLRIERLDLEEANEFVLKRIKECECIA